MKIVMKKMETIKPSTITIEEKYENLFFSRFLLLLYSEFGGGGYKTCSRKHLFISNDVPDSCVL